MKFVVGNFKKVFSKDETEKVLREYENEFYGDKIYFCVIPECSEIKSKFKLFSQFEDECGRVLLGHSDFKAIYHMSDKETLKNVIENLKLGANILYCVGENKQQKEKNKTKKVLKAQTKGLKKFVSTNLILVYEPVYALGGANPPEISTISENVAFIKKLLPGVNVLYGGSVNETNAEKILRSDIIDGVFLHRASLYKEKIAKIVEIAKKY